MPAEVLRDRPWISWNPQCSQVFPNLAKLANGPISKCLKSRKKLVDVTGFEPATPCLQSQGNFNLSRRFGCAYHLRTCLDCSKIAPNCTKQLSLNCTASLASLQGVRPKSNFYA